MEQLRQSDLRAIRRFVRDCYAIRELKFESFLERLVRSLPRLIPAAHVTYNEMYPLKSESRNCVNTAELASPLAGQLWEQHMNEHPVMTHVLTTADHHAARISDFWSRRELHDRGLYNDFYQHYEIEDALCITVACRPPRIIGIGWHDNRIFTDRERLIADIIRPHIGQAWRNARIVSRMEQQLQALRAGFEMMGAGIIMCDADGRVQVMNARSRRYLAEYLGVSRLLDRRLPDELLRWARQQNAALVTSEVPPVFSPLVYEREGKRLAVRLLSQHGMAMILMEETARPSREADLDRFGLTPREFEVLTWIAQGKTNSEIAAILTSSVGTVKKHVEHVFLKLGVETRTSAAAIVLGSHPPARA